MRRESRITRLTKLYRRSLGSELQLDEAFLKEAEKVLFSYDSFRLRRYSSTSPVEELGPVVDELVKDDIISEREADKFLGLVEEFYGSSRIRSRVYADEGGSLAQDLAQSGVGIGLGTAFTTLLFVGLNSVGNILSDSNSGAVTKIAAIAMVVLVGLLSGKMYAFGFRGAYEAAKRLLKRSRPLFDKVYDLLLKLARRLNGIKKIFGKTQELEKFVEENSQDIDDISKALENELK